ncbi:homocysteine S-methyltransferase family protein [Campylobacter sp. RM12920]|uniref:Homocysteine S-methyltransferase family protein n=1 Tax=Campylobacter californiensis TaxID=1032243 RepID=A0ABD4JGZ7_9BACT|nr:homocysteine S-methyltransferase family protein [Campylobacter sp. RM12919]MBE2988291.1 homocysteine S-methyltransferase family protein [Campylobacter sp. RM12920]
MLQNLSLRLRDLPLRGFNCISDTLASALLANLKKAGGTKPFIIYPNAGAVYDAKTQKWSEKPDESGLIKYIQKWHELGARLIGGCCQTSPEFIRQLSEILKTKI